jgi:(R,R)-butanediol dehydrogenase/meso-butanediol dehydrogenase/diacetyl reductase
MTLSDHSPDRMRAVRWHARGDVRLDVVPVPNPGKDEVLIRIEAAGICGTDIDEVAHGPITVPVEPHRVSGRSAPVTLGHEIVGIVDAAGPTAGIPVGTRVAPWPLAPCGVCSTCRTGHQNRCPDLVALGMSADGGMADFLVVEGGRCARVGEAVAPERAVLVEPFAVALHAVHLAPVKRARVAVVGVGSLGICLVEAALLRGADEVVALSRSAASRDMAHVAGAVATGRLEDAATLDVDVVFETGGSPATIAASQRAVRAGGRIVVLGAHPGSTRMELLDLTVREVVVAGSVSHCFDADFVAAAAGITSGELARTTRRVELAPMERGPELLRTPGSAVKRILVPGLT